ncbi:MAG: heme-binding protein [Flaviramulus sp.]|nr:heme-binding protein [Flaviramulus sp.]
MKIIFIVVGVLFLVFVIIQVFAIRSQNGIEKYPYTIIKSHKNFEIRNYEAMLFTSVKLNSHDYKKASSQGFSILAGYIFGGNETKDKIAMTSPVSISLEDSMTMMFMVPKKFQKENLPKPNQSNIKFNEEPAKTMIAISFGGWANSNKIENYKNKLKAALDAEGIYYTNKFYFFGYNAPFEVFNRRNEVIVEIDNYTIN